MKIVASDEEKTVFHLTDEERMVLVKTLKLYPVLPPAHQKVTRELKTPQVDEFQHLLDEALASQRKANKARVEKWLAAPDRFKPGKTGCEMAVKRDQAEWLLQVLNDIRVGSWILLGSPENRLDPNRLAPAQLVIWITMEVCGFYQMALLQAMHGP